MTTYREFQQELEKLHQQAETARRIEKSAALEKIRSLIIEYQLRPSDLGLAAGGKANGSRSLVAAKFRDPSSGATWSGRGRAPRWLDGQDRSKFAIA